MSDREVSKLNEGNYQQWKIEVKDILQSVEVWEVASGKEACPPEEKEKEYRMWIKKDSKARTYLRKSLDQDHFNSVRDRETSWAMLSRIKELREPKSANLSLEAWKDFTTYGWKEGMNVTSFWAGLTVITGKLQITDDLKVTDNMIMAKVLASLPKEYKHFVTSWNISATEKMALDTFRQKLMSAEREIQKEKFEETNTEAGEVYRATSRFKKNLNITERSKEQFRGKCFLCNKQGHRSNECPWKKKLEQMERETERGNDLTQSENKNKKPALYASEVALQVSNEKDKVIMDGGASIHMTRNRDWFDTYQDLQDPVHISIADGSTMYAVGIGDIEIEVSANGTNYKRMTWKDVYHVPNMGSVSLLSEMVLDEREYKIETRKGVKEISKDGEVTLRAERRRNTFVPLLEIIRPNHKGMSAKTLSLEVWHQRLGHVNDEVIKTMKENELVTGMSVSLSKRKPCEGCLLGKKTRNTHKTRKEERKCEPGEFIHSDLCEVGGPSWDGHKYFITFKDEKSSYRTVHFLKNKSQVASTLRNFITRAEQETGRKVKRLRTDNGTEYTNEEVETLLKEKEILHERTPPRVKPCNGTAERENRILQDTTRSLLYSADITREQRRLLWTEAIATAAYLRNRVPKKGHSNRTPYSEWFNKIPDVSHLRVWGSKAYTHAKDQNLKKYDARAKQGLFVGYDSMTDRVIRVFYPEKGKVERVSDCKIIDDTYEDDEPTFLTHFDESNEEEEDVEEREDEEENDGLQLQNEQSQHDEELDMDPPSRVKRKYVRRTFTPHEMTRRSNKQNHLQAMSAMNDPETYEETNYREDTQEWKTAMNEEIKSLQENETWTLTELPYGKNLVSNKWVFKTKLNPDGSISKRKARLVARGFSQKEGIDFYETFAPVVRYETVRLILSLAAQEKLFMKQFDVKTAFLYGPLEEEIYMTQPEGFEDGSNRVCRLKKGLYGLKQSPRAWNNRFNDFVEQLGLKRSAEDQCLYHSNSKETGRVMMTLYVDDGLLCASESKIMDELLQKLGREFKITIEDPHCYVGMEITQSQDRAEIRVTQQGYVKKMLSRIGMNEAKTVTSPTDPNAKLTESTESDLQEKMTRIPYREAVGALNYLSVTSRPDITYAVAQVAKYCANPNNSHWHAVKRIMRYLRGTEGRHITYKTTNDKTVTGYSDSDWAGDLDTRCSTSGYIFILNNGPISWSSKQHRTAALSSTEAEYIAMTEAMKEALWIRPLLKELNFLTCEAIVVKVDNQAALNLSRNAEFHKRTKYISVKYHRIRQEQEKGKIRIRVCRVQETSCGLSY
jgi:hypothetical protein